MAAEEEQSRPRSSVPVPDPTVLTTQAVDRAIASYREVVDAQIKNLETRLHGMDRATELIAEELVKTINQTSEMCARIREDFGRDLAALRESYTLQIANVRDVSLEKFAAVDTRFLERDTRTEETAQQSRISLDAALAAAKEAVGEQNRANSLAIGKSEGATQKQIDAMTELMATSNRALEDKIADLKGRLDRGEGQDKGTTEMRQRNQLQSNWSIGLLITTGLAALGSAVAIILALIHK